MSTIHLPEITGPVDDAIEVIRVCAEKGYFEDEDLLARLIKARAQVERVGIALHLASQFVRLIEPVHVDQSVSLVGSDLVNAIRKAAGRCTVREHYEAMALGARPPLARVGGVV